MLIPHNCIPVSIPRRLLTLPDFLRTIYTAKNLKKKNQNQTSPKKKKRKEAEELKKLPERAKTNSDSYILLRQLSIDSSTSRRRALSAANQSL